MGQIRSTHFQIEGESIDRVDESPSGIGTMCTSPGQDSPFLKLPQELQDQIVSHVPLEDLSSLWKTCVALRVTTLPFLFEEIDIDSDSPRHESFVQSLQRTLKESAPLAAMVKSLTIKKARTSSDVLEKLLPHTRNLGTLFYDYWVDQQENINRYDCIDASHLRDLLEPVKSTLTHLKVTYDIEVPDEYFHERNIVGNCSLNHLSALSILEIPLFVLLGWVSEEAPDIADVIPPGLTRLYFEEDAWWSDSGNWNGTAIMQVLISFVESEKWRETTPHLQSLSLCLCSEEDWKESMSGIDAMVIEPPSAEPFFKYFCEKNSLECSIFRFPQRFWGWFLGLRHGRCSLGKLDPAFLNTT